MSEVRSSELDTGLSSSGGLAERDTAVSVPREVRAFHALEERCGLDDDTLRRFRDRFQFPDRVRVRLPNEEERACHFFPGEVCFYESAFVCGLRFPVHPVVMELLDQFGIAPGQLMPNSWRILVSCMGIWLAALDGDMLRVDEFNYLYRLKASKEHGYYELVPWERSTRIVKKLPSSFRYWKSRFFFVSGDDFETPSGEVWGDLPRLHRRWGTPTLASVQFRKKGRACHREEQFGASYFSASPVASGVVTTRTASPTTSLEEIEVTPASKRSRLTEKEKEKEKSVPRPSTLWTDERLAVDRAHEVVTAADLKVLSGVPFNDVAARHVHKLVQVLGESMHIASEYLTQETKVASLTSRMETLEAENSTLRKNLIESMGESASLKEKLKTLEDELRVERQLTLEKDEQLISTKESLKTIAARSIEAFQTTEEYSTVLFSWYFKGFELLRRFLLKHPSGVDMEKLDLEEVNQEMAADELANLLPSCLLPVRMLLLMTLQLLTTPQLTMVLPMPDLILRKTFVVEISHPLFFVYY
ncbi:uncharacterized protein LOC136062378 [Quercus suber]|uniref:uncharacterized protein LOC136062378 n=1 Tax=Quercus suber TaxID=58331 RepID=UPI0032DF57C6